MPSEEKPEKVSDIMIAFVVLRELEKQGLLPTRTKAVD